MDTKDLSIKNLYQEKLKTPEEIAGQFQSGWSCVTDAALAAPKALYTALGERARGGDIRGITVYTFLDLFPVAWYEQPLKEKIQGISWFSGPGARAAVAAGHCDVMPCHYSDAPKLVRDYVDVDAYCITVSPMDKHGYFSTGCSASISFALKNKAKRIYLEVNAHMPRTLTAPIIHISEVAALCESSEPLITLPPAESDAESAAIGNLIAAEVPDAATIQLGIGAIPNEVGKALKVKRNLGIHTELLTDGMIELLECGAADNSRKPIHIGRTVATFAFGSKRIYDYIDDNPAVEMLPVDYVNDPALIAQHPNFVSVNAALEVDFFGQVSAESLGTRHISGSGGQVDYVRGAVMSKGGKSFIAFPSTAANGTVSKITPTLKAGSIVTTGKNEVDHIVTEYGIAKLRGQPLSKRVKALISIAHPKFRDELTFAAKKQNIII